MITDTGRRIGRFSISEIMVKEHPEDVLKVLSQCLVVRCELKYDIMAFEYMALSPLFEETAFGLVAPDYTAHFERVNVASEGEEPIWGIQFKGFIRS